MRARDIVLRTPVLAPVALFAYRLYVAGQYVVEPFGPLARWLVRSRETTNFTYDLAPLNQRYLAALLADVLSTEASRIASFINELEHDAELRAHLEETTRKVGRYSRADSTARYGRRVGWYAVARMVKPRVIVETGVDKGLGSCVLTAALARNAAEGSPGYYYGTDINPSAGFLLTGKYRMHGEVLIGDSIASLRGLTKSVDLFINDSDHSAEYERAEYGAISSRLAPEAIILGDNAHVTSELLEFALATGRRFVFFQERPSQHWYPGGGIGIAFRRSAPRV